MNELLWWVFYFVGYLMEYCNLDLDDAVRQACGEINVVLLRHNGAVRDIQQGKAKNRYVPTSDLSDNQCVLLLQLRKDTIYKMVAVPEPLLDYGIQGRVENSHSSEQGSALEGFAAIVMLMIIVCIAVYLFVWPFVDVAINFGDIISGIY